MKHLLTIFVVVTVARCPSAAFTDDAIPPLKVVEGFLKEDEIDYFLNFEINTNIGESSFYGTATMPSKILNRLPRNQDDLEHHCKGKGSSADETSAVIMTKMMTNTSHFHKDMITGIGGVVGCNPPIPEDTDIHDDVAIIFLNTNEAAYFNRDDAQVPAVAGTLVAFNGEYHHNTVINSGNVRIAGPFHLKTMQYVYSTRCDGDSTCGTPCNCNGENCDLSCLASDGTTLCEACSSESCEGRDRNLEAAENASSKLDALKKNMEEDENRRLVDKDDCGCFDGEDFGKCVVPGGTFENPCVGEKSSKAPKDSKAPRSSKAPKSNKAGKA